MKLLRNIVISHQNHIIITVDIYFKLKFTVWETSLNEFSITPLADKKPNKQKTFGNLPQNKGTTTKGVKKKMIIRTIEMLFNIRERPLLLL